MKKIFFITIISIYILFSNTAKATDKLNLILDWFLNPDHAPIIIGIEKGFFSKENLKLNIIIPGDPNDPPKLVAAKKADIAISYQPQLHMQVDQGLPLIRIGTLVSSPLNSLIVLKESSIKSIGDLKGRKIGFSVGGFEKALLKTMLEKQNLKLEEIELVNVNFSLSPALVSKKVDAVIGAFRNFELNHLSILKKPGKAFFVEEHGVPAYEELIIVANTESLDDNRLTRFLKALEHSTHYLLNHPNESWEIFIKNRPELDNELNKKAWKDTLPRFSMRPAAFDQGRYKRFADFLYNKKVIKKSLPPSSYGVSLR